MLKFKKIKFNKDISKMACENVQNPRDIKNINENNLENLPDDEDKVFFTEYLNNKNYFEETVLNRSKLTDLQKSDIARYPDYILDNLSNLGVIRIKDILGYFLNGLIDKEQLNKYSKKLINFIPRQILDEKFEKVGDPITKQELIDYKNSNFIDESLLNKYLRLIEERDKIKEEKIEIKKNTQSSLEQEKSEFNV